MKPKVVIEVDGGNVQAVFSNCEVDVVLIDHDNMKAEGKGYEAREAAMVAACAGGLGQVF